MIFKKFKKESSVLDFNRETLCPDIWEDTFLKKEVRDFIYQQTITFFERRSLRRYQGFIQDCYIASSLASYNYKEYTDFDIKFVIDCSIFKKYNTSFQDMSDEDIIDYLIETARNSQELTAFVPNTEHELDPYFYDEFEGVEENLIKYDSLYSIGKNQWIKEPKKLPAILPPNFFLEKAKQYAEPFLSKVQKDIAKVKSDSIDFMLMKDYLNKLDDVSIKEINFYYNQQLALIDKDLDELIENREIIKKIRSDNFSKKSLTTFLEKLGGSLNYGKGNLIFKLFQRYGYMKILNEIKTLTDKRSVNPTDLPILLSIINA